MRCTALITGASAGLGRELARQLAAQRVDLVLVARDAARLEDIAEQLRQQYGVRVDVLAADLTEQPGQESVAARLQRDDTPVDILINNAGFGINAGFETSGVADERRLHELLAWVPLRLCHAVVPGMLRRGRGWILNVASVAAFTPAGTYGAAKAGLVSLSRALRARYRRRGLSVTVLCPGLLATEFHDRMGIDHLPALPPLAWAPVERVAREGLRGLRRGRRIVVSDWRYRLAAPLTRLLPDRLLERLTTTSERGA
ncbi:SDR family NAD(P)-dependent oxidoreductase [Leucobacter triazinivorans]|uniref:SDR family NAD(P)-dependent oxidoreductase n=1 Tax=Leucobacter triazinivorans TaxID=1784719 RepID=A0A4P6KED3_9MICO|nr:SDR family NAD(P)-dependent oxidoreductase [Leucobacter triazinivorans]QBE47754.1 SDR family NAD(P)-dependent oxidoreductase [Leucobacter triazinivorans]